MALKSSTSRHSVLGVPHLDPQKIFVSNNQALNLCNITCPLKNLARSCLNHLNY